MAGQRLGGTCFLKINGSLYPVKGNWAYSPTATTKTGVAGQDNVHGFTEKPRVPYMKGDISDFGGISIQKLQASDIEIATLELNNEKVITGQSGWVADDIEVGTEEGKYELKLEFTLMTEQTSS